MFLLILIPRLSSPHSSSQLPLLSSSRSIQRRSRSSLNLFLLLPALPPAASSLHSVSPRQRDQLPRTSNTQDVSLRRNGDGGGAGQLARTQHQHHGGPTGDCSFGGHDRRRGKVSRKLRTPQSSHGRIRSCGHLSTRGSHRPGTACASLGNPPKSVGRWTGDSAARCTSAEAYTSTSFLAVAAVSHGGHACFVQYSQNSPPGPFPLHFAPWVVFFPPGRTSFHGPARTRTTASRSTFTTAGLTPSASRM